MDITNNKSSNWRLWCRLCTKDNATNITNMLLKTEERANEMEIDHHEKLVESNNHTNKALVAAIEKHFAVNLRDSEELPKSLCTECFTFVRTLMVFVDRVAKAQHFFLILQQAKEDTQFDSNTLRSKYGLSNEGGSSSATYQQPEVHYFDTKPEICDAQEEKVFEPEIIITDPLEVPKLRLRIKTEKTEADKAVLVVASEVIEQVKTASIEDDEDEDDEDNLTIKALQKSERKKERAEDQIELGSKGKTKKIKKLSKRSSAFKSKKRKCTSNDGDEESSSNKLPAEYTEENAKTEKTTSNEEEDAELLTCEECSMKFKRINIYQKHMKDVHSKDVPKCYTCPHCSRAFKRPCKLRNHLLVHKPIESRRVVPCPHCDKKFTSPSMVEFHVNYIHKDVRPFICEECGETCRTNAELRCHILTHTDYAPFQCEVCQKGFKEKCRLKIHMQVHDPVKPICTECGLQLSTRSTLKRHMLVHSSEMQHKCDYCGRAFKRSKTLKNHLLLHTGLKPYTCNFCDRTFANGSNCRTHKKRAHPEELAALEATGSTKTNKLNIPKLKTLKALNKKGENLLPVVSKQSGNSFEKSQIKQNSPNAAENKPKVDLQPFVPPNQYINYMFMLPPSTT